MIPIGINQMTDMADTTAMTGTVRGGGLSPSGPAVNASAVANLVSGWEKSA
ncbi:hypothetical protein [Streptomyces cellulosae]|uniref:Uncharacterized protein n=1 Tax=Streptomyces cellulosae TaxID=1968 RepID=A0ABW7Y9M9_STRCE